MFDPAFGPSTDELRDRVARASRLVDQARDAIQKARDAGNKDLSLSRVDEIRNRIAALRADLFEAASELRALDPTNSVNISQGSELDGYMSELGAAIERAKKAGLQLPKDLNEEISDEKKRAEASFWDPLKEALKGAGETLATALKWILYGVVAVLILLVAYYGLKAAGGGKAVAATVAG